MQDFKVFYTNEDHRQHMTPKTLILTEFMRRNPAIPRGLVEINQREHNPFVYDLKVMDKKFTVTVSAKTKEQLK